MKLTVRSVDRIRRELDKLELQRWLREQLQLQGIDIESYEFEDEEERDTGLTC